MDRTPEECLQRLVAPFCAAFLREVEVVPQPLVLAYVEACGGIGVDLGVARVGYVTETRHRSLSVGAKTRLLGCHVTYALNAMHAVAEQACR